MAEIFINQKKQLTGVDRDQLLEASDSVRKWLKNKDAEDRNAMISVASARNPWFEKEHVEFAINQVADAFFDPDKIRKWLSAYVISRPENEKKVGLILAGNIPMVGLHDVICVLWSGHLALAKVSEKDNVLIPAIIHRLSKSCPVVSERIQFVDRLTDFDAIVATGSNQSADQFEKYFGKYRHIIRRNRNGVAVLTGQETTSQLKELGIDVFQFFGLGCRNVSKLYVPEGYDFEPLLSAFRDFDKVMLHNKYKNNYEFNLATWILNGVPYMNNDVILLKEDASLTSRIGTLHYEYYRDENDLVAKLKESRDKIQCVVGSISQNTEVLPFGSAQRPELGMYADGVDTMQFLIDL